MFRAARSWLRSRSRQFRFMAVAFAVACQASAGATVPMQDAAEVQIRLAASVAVFCQSSVHPVKHDGVPLHRQVPDHALCRVLPAHGHAVAVMDDVPILPAPALGKIGAGHLPGARAPPARNVCAAFPRGPPISV